MQSRNRLLFALVTVWSFSTPEFLAAQDSTADTVLFMQALEAAENKLPRNQKRVFFGRAYRPLAYQIKRGHPFLSSDQAVTGDLLYHDVLYRNQDFRYDLVLDEVIFEHSPGQLIALTSEHLKSFTLEGRVFRRLDGINRAQGDLKPGYYEELAVKDGIVLFARRSKKIRGNPHNRPYFEETTRYFLFFKGNYHKVANAHAITRILYGEKIELNSSEKDHEKKMVLAIQNYQRPKL